GTHNGSAMTLKRTGSSLHDYAAANYTQPTTHQPSLSDYCRPIHATRTSSPCENSGR
ncbi:hypothetical protein SARC_14788, partial [Sphaeroforma arctica JP610]